MRLLQLAGLAERENPRLEACEEGSEQCIRRMTELYLNGLVGRIGEDLQNINDAIDNRHKEV